MAGIDWSTKLGRRALEQLADREIIWLTTVGAGGGPQPSPVWFLWTEGELLVVSRPGKPKLRNIARNPRVGMNFDTDPLGEEITVITGTARLDDAGMTSDERAVYDAKYAASIRRIGYTPDRFHADYSVPIRVAPGGLRGF